MLFLGYDFLALKLKLVTLQMSDSEFRNDRVSKGMVRKRKPTSLDVVSSKPKEMVSVFCAINHGLCIKRLICDRNVNKIIKKSIRRLSCVSDQVTWRFQGLIASWYYARLINKRL